MNRTAPRAMMALGLLTVAALLIAGCGSAPSPAVFADPSGLAPASAGSDPTTVANTSQVLPLTGYAAASTQQNLPVVAAALAAGDTADSRVDRAETVFVEYSDSLRLLALFQSVTVSHVGPVIQTRPADGTILGITHAIYANAGGPTGFVMLLDQSAVSDASTSRDPGAYFTTTQGAFTATDALRQAVPDAQGSPPLFTFATTGQKLAAAAKAVHRATVSVQGQSSVTWSYDPMAKDWTTTDPSFAGVQPHSLIFQAVPYKTVQLHHPGGAYVPSARVYGHGAALVVSAGMAVNGQWSKPGPESLTTYGDANGVPVHIDPGITWVFLVPVGTPVSVS